MQGSTNGVYLDAVTSLDRTRDNSSSQGAQGAGHQVGSGADRGRSGSEVLSRKHECQAKKPGQRKAVACLDGWARNTNAQQWTQLILYLRREREGERRTGEKTKEG